MAYNNGFPVSYPQIYPQYPQAGGQISQPNIYQNGNNTSNSIIWVQGEAGAKSYLVAPNTTVQLWDSEEQVIYLKSADASGMPAMKILDYKIRDVNQNVTPNVLNANNNDFATKKELKELRDNLIQQIEKIAKNTQNGVEKDESII